jgi:hypothetical protein
MARSSVSRLACLLASVVVAVGLSLTHSPAYGWDAKGHQIVALIVERHLTEQARERLKQLLPKNETLEQAATWPDRIRKIMRQMEPLHYVDVPRGCNYYDRERDCLQQNCIVEAINWYVKVK